MHQARGLAELVNLARRERDMDTIVYTGYTLEQLKQSPLEGVPELLTLTDVLIDGPYNPQLNDNQGLRGSRNQSIHHLTLRLACFDFENCIRRLEVFINHGNITTVGIMPAGFIQPLDMAIGQSFGGAV